ncbi:MAG: GAF domain-containing protein, partial [Anaerolineales bacterium]
WEQSEVSNSRSALSVPLMTHDRVVGVVTLVHPQAGRFTMEDLALLTAIAVTVSYSFNREVN